ncbi:MAG: hypothetical protein WCS70_13265 [Verrucomicrobiota bacterium]
MDFIKKHFEKLLLAGGLVVLIGCAAYLGYRVAKLSDEVQDSPRLSRGKKKAEVVATPTAIYSNAITGLQVPSLWQTNAIDPFHTQLEWTAPVAILITNRTAGPGISLLQVIRKQFTLKFQSYKEPGEEFAVNFITRNKTFFVKKIGMEIADTFEKTGFVITKFEKKQTEVFNKGLGITNKVDLSELTIEKKDAPPIVLILGKVAQEREPVAALHCQTDNQERRLRKGDELTCGGKTYKVIDITPTQVLIEDVKTKEQSTISLPGVKE